MIAALLKRRPLHALGIAEVVRNARLHWHAITTWGMHPLSPNMPRAILKRNAIERSA